MDAPRPGIAGWVPGLMLAAVCCSPQPGNAPPAGSTHFRDYCAACHQYDGQGMGDAPPLAGSPWVSGSQERLIKIILHGLRGRIEIEGKTYDREMPGFGPVLADAEIADLLTFVRNQFGRRVLEVSAESVAKVRAATAGRTTYWHVRELAAGQ